jgi:hypothetical protein
VRNSRVICFLRRAALPIALVAAAGCAKIRPLTAPLPQAGNADFSVYVAMGTSYSAGFQSGGLAQRHQVLSFPYLFARQAGAPVFTYPAVNLGGWPPLVRLKSLGPPLVIDSVGVQRGAFVNVAQPTPYHNIAVPGALLADVLNILLNYDPTLPRDATFFNNILRQGQQTIPLSMLDEVISLRPTFLSFEFGTTEMLAAAVHGSGTTFPAASFGGLLNVTLNALDGGTPGAKKVIFNVPDVTAFPFFNTLPIVELTAAGGPAIGGGGPKFLLAPSGNLVPGDRVGLNALKLLAGIPNVTSAPDSGAWGYALGDTSYLSGYPVPGNGRSLPDSAVLSIAEVAAVQQSVQDYNTAIATQASARGYALVDLNGFMNSLVVRGYVFAGNTYSTKFVTGGLFSLDGVHITDFAHGLLCNEMIRVVNEKFGSRIQPADLARTMTASSSTLSRGGSPPGWFGSSWPGGWAGRAP